MSDAQHEAYRPLIEDGRGIFPEDFRVKAPKGFNDAVLAEVLLQPVGHTEDAAVQAHVLPEHDDALVLRHLLAEGEVDRIDQVELGHCGILRHAHQPDGVIPKGAVAT